MDIDIDDFETRYELITELLKHLQKREVSKEDKRILYDMIINKGYGTDKEREHCQHPRSPIPADPQSYPPPFQR